MTRKRIPSIGGNDKACSLETENHVGGGVRRPVTLDHRVRGRKAAEGWVWRALNAKQGFILDPGGYREPLTFTE